MGGRRCLYLFIDYPDADEELAIVASRVPGISDRLAEQLVRFAQSLRRSSLRKQPGISETVDWAMALIAISEIYMVPLHWRQSQHPMKVWPVSTITSAVFSHRWDSS